MPIRSWIGEMAGDDGMEDEGGSGWGDAEGREEMCSARSMKREDGEGESFKK